MKLTDKFVHYSLCRDYDNNSYNKKLEQINRELNQKINQQLNDIDNLADYHVQIEHLKNHRTIGINNDYQTDFQLIINAYLTHK